MRGTAIGLRREDLLNELEENWYFVGRMAYDFQSTSKDKNKLF